MGKLKITRSLFLLFTFFLMGLTGTATLKIGDRAPMINERMNEVSGRTISLADAAGRNGLIVVFSGNTCPWVAKWESRYNRIASYAQSRGIGMIAINSNERIRNRGESMAEMKQRAQKQNYTFSYALDTNHTLADAFGATKTPEVFFFNADLRLVYHGAIDDNANSATNVQSEYLSDAIRAILAGENVTIQETDFPGCTIKRGR